MLRTFIVLLAVLWSSSAFAQAPVNPCIYVDQNQCTRVSAGNPLPVTASVSVGGFPTTQTTGTPISVTTGGVTGTLPTGAVVVATNVGTTNAAYCKLGASATTSDQYIAPSGGWFSFTVGAATQLTCITSTSTTTVNMVGGSGLPTGTGGGSGGGGGGAVTIADGADVAEGLTTDAAATAGSTGTVSAKLRLVTTQLATIATNTGAAVPAGTANIGNVGGTVNVTPTDCSGTIATGGTAQNAFTAGATKHGFTIQNLATESMTISFTGTAGAIGAAGSYTLNPASSGVAGGSYSTPLGFGMNTALSVRAATTSSVFSCTWW